MIDVVYIAIFVNGLLPALRHVLGVRVEARMDPRRPPLLHMHVERPSSERVPSDPTLWELRVALAITVFTHAEEWRWRGGTHEG